jgi:hypothetical protein
MSLASSMYGYKYSFSVGNDVLYNKKISKILELVNEHDEDIDDFMPLYKIQEYESKIIKTHIPEDQLFPVSDIDIINYNNALRRSIDLEKLSVRYNSFIKDNIYKLTFDLELYIFEFTPIKVILTIDEKHYFLVIMYELKMTNRITNIIIKTEIPYYVSDGHTNELRANLLFPFMCFNESLSQYSCPFSQGKILSKGGLFKYSILQNIDLDEYHKNIQELLKTQIPIDNNKGITSVLPRIVNLLDLFICLNNKNLINYNEGKLNHYYPIRDKKLKVRSKLSLDMTKEDNLTFFKFGAEDDYRELLLPVLQNLIINFQKLPFFKSEIVDITLTTDNIVTKPYFNSFIIKNPICKGPKINDDSRRNIDIYSEISLQFGQQFKKCLNEIKKELDTIDEMNIINRYEKGYPIKKPYPIEFEMLINEVLDLIKDKPSKKNIINQLNMWNINCNYKKYKKYKMKYIALKAKMLENI